LPYCQKENNHWRLEVSTKAGKEHKAKVAALGCLACRCNGIEDTPAELHHITTRKRTDFTVIPLCPFHHRGLGVALKNNESVHGARQVFEDKFGTQDEILAIVHQETGYEENTTNTE